MVSPVWPPRIPLENPDELLLTAMFGAGAVIRLQSSATEAGVYADVSGTGSTPTIAIITLTRIYTGYDPSATTSTWFRWRVENVGGTKLGDWSTSFQVTGEENGQLCSLYDAKQRLGILSTDTTADEDLLEFIRQTTVDIEGYCGRWFVPRPQSGTTTYRVHTRYGKTLRLPKGIRSVTTLNVAVEDQPSSSGTYTTATSTDYFIDPPEMERDSGWPGMRIVFRANAAGSVTVFSDASFGAEIVGTFGWSAPPSDIQSVALNSVVRHWKAKSTGQSEVIGSSEFGGRLLRFISPEEREKLGWYRHIEMV